MRDLTVGMVVCLLMGVAAGAQTSDPQLIAPIQKFIESFNKGDMAGAAATHAAEADLVILDEVAPFLWRGAPRVSAMEHRSGQRRQEKRHHGSDGKDRRARQNGNERRPGLCGGARRVHLQRTWRGYTEKAQMTFALRKGPSGWLIHGWTWTGPKPTGAAKK